MKVRKAMGRPGPTPIYSCNLPWKSGGVTHWKPRASFDPLACRVFRATALSQRIVLRTPTGTQILSSVPSMCRAPSGVAGSCLSPSCGPKPLGVTSDSRWSTYCSGGTSSTSARNWLFLKLTIGETIHYDVAFFFPNYKFCSLPWVAPWCKLLVLSGMTACS